MFALLLATIALTLEPPVDAVKTPAGVSTLILAPGTGTVHPESSDYVQMHYTIYSVVGKPLQTVKAPQMGTVAMEKLNGGWRDVVLQMVVGEQRRAWVDDDSMIIDTELIGIVKPPPIPADVAAPPAEATVTKSGLAYKVLRTSTETKHPSRRSKVRVHYSGWTTDGKMFDSSVVRGEPSEFPVDAVIAGWSEGLQLMVPGEVARFWIPARLAYAKDAGKPQGMLVFDVELLAIK
jgi:FKBP-type peptidyl-prolyl cis-trans isomerase